MPTGHTTYKGKKVRIYDHPIGECCGIKFHVHEDFQRHRQKFHGAPPNVLEFGRF